MSLTSGLACDASKNPWLRGWEIGGLKLQEEGEHEDEDEGPQEGPQEGEDEHVKLLLLDQLGGVDGLLALLRSSEWRVVELSCALLSCLCAHPDVAGTIRQRLQTDISSISPVLERGLGREDQSVCSNACLLVTCCFTFSKDGGAAQPGKNVASSVEEDIPRLIEALLGLLSAHTAASPGRKGADPFGDPQEEQQQPQQEEYQQEQQQPQPPPTWGIVVLSALLALRAVADRSAFLERGAAQACFRIVTSRHQSPPILPKSGSSPEVATEGDANYAEAAAQLAAEAVLRCVRCAARSSSPDGVCAKDEEAMGSFPQTGHHGVAESLVSLCSLADLISLLETDKEHIQALALHLISEALRRGVLEAKRGENAGRRRASLSHSASFGQSNNDDTSGASSVRRKRILLRSKSETPRKEDVAGGFGVSGNGHAGVKTQRLPLLLCGTGAVRVIVWLLQHQEAEVRSCARKALLHLTFLHPKWFLSCVEQGCVPILMLGQSNRRERGDREEKGEACQTTSEGQDELADEFRQGVLEPLQLQVCGPLLPHLNHMISSPGNGLSRSNAAVALVLLSTRQGLLGEEAISAVLTMLRTPVGRPPAVLVLRLLAAFVDEPAPICNTFRGPHTEMEASELWRGQAAISSVDSGGGKEEDCIVLIFDTRLDGIPVKMACPPASLLRLASAKLGRLLTCADTDGMEDPETEQAPPKKKLAVLCGRYRVWEEVMGHLAATHTFTKAAEGYSIALLTDMFKIATSYELLELADGYAVELWGRVLHSDLAAAFKLLQAASGAGHWWLTRHAFGRLVSLLDTARDGSPAEGVGMNDLISSLRASILLLLSKQGSQ